VLRSPLQNCASFARANQPTERLSDGRIGRPTACCLTIRTSIAGALMVISSAGHKLESGSGDLVVEVDRRMTG